MWYWRCELQYTVFHLYSPYPDNTCLYSPWLVSTPPVQLISSLHLMLQPFCMQSVTHLYRPCPYPDSKKYLKHMRSQYSVSVGQCPDCTSSLQPKPNQYHIVKAQYPDSTWMSSAHVEPLLILTAHEYSISTTSGQIQYIKIRFVWPNFLSVGNTILGYIFNI